MHGCKCPTPYKEKDNFDPGANLLRCNDCIDGNVTFTIKGR